MVSSLQEALVLAKKTIKNILPLHGYDNFSDQCFLRVADNGGRRFLFLSHMRAARMDC